MIQRKLQHSITFSIYSAHSANGISFRDGIRTEPEPNKPN